MLIYEYRCKHCGTDYEAIRPIERHAEGPECCGEMSEQVIRTAPQGYVDNMNPYECPITHQPVTTRRQRRYMMEKMDVIDANDMGWNPDKARAEKAKNEAEIAAIKAEIPKDLKAGFDGVKKDTIDRFKKEHRI